MSSQTFPAKMISRLDRVVREIEPQLPPNVVLTEHELTIILGRLERSFSKIIEEFHGVLLEDQTATREKMFRYVFFNTWSDLDTPVEIEALPIARFRDQCKRDLYRWAHLTSLYFARGTYDSAFNDTVKSLGTGQYDGLGYKSERPWAVITDISKGKMIAPADRIRFCLADLAKSTKTYMDAKSQWLKAEQPYTALALMRELADTLVLPLKSQVVEDLVQIIVESSIDYWLKYGGVELPSWLPSFYTDIAKMLSVNVSIVTGEWDYYNESGLPQRPDVGELALSLNAVMVARIEGGIKGKLKFDASGWDEFTPFIFVNRIADMYRTRISMSTNRAPQHPAPVAQPYGVSPRGAEKWICDWLIHMGLKSAQVTRATSDGGVDIVASGAVAQVKLYASPVSIEELRELVGAAALHSGPQQLLFFCSGGFHASGIQFADVVGMALYEFNPEQGLVLAVNGAARKTVLHGFNEAQISRG